MIVYQAHCLCKCPDPDDMIPLDHSHFILDQRSRSGERSHYLIGKPDRAASERAAQLLAEKEEEKKKKSRKGTRLAKQAISFGNVVELASSSDTDGISELACEEPSSSSSLITIDTKELKRKVLLNVAREAERYKMSNREVSAICNALLTDLGLISLENEDLIFDKSKIHRIREKLRKGLFESFDAPRKPIEGLEYDGRKDKTLVRNESSGGIRLEKEEHFSVLRQPGRNFLTHFTPATGGSEDICAELLQIITQKSLTGCIKVLACDSTNVNTGHLNGVNVRLERELDHRLLWLVCMLHTNELPLRHLMTALDGPTTGKDSFSGPIGRAAKQANTLDAKTFQAIPVETDMHQLPEDIVNDLSSDQKFLYQITKAVRSGSAPQKLYGTKIGLMDHSRWVTLANRILRLYISDHSLTGLAMKNLETLVTFIVVHYAPMWFEIKCEPLYKNGPKHVLTSVSVEKHD